MRDDDRIRKHTGVRTFSRVSFWASHSNNIMYYSTFCQQTPLKEGKSQMESSVQDNPAAPSPCQYTLKALLNSVLGYSSNTQSAQHFLNRLVSSHAVSTSTAMSGCFQPGQAKSCWVLPPCQGLLYLYLMYRVPHYPGGERELQEGKNKANVGGGWRGEPGISWLVDPVHLPWGGGGGGGGQEVSPILKYSGDSRAQTQFLGGPAARPVTFLELLFPTLPSVADLDPILFWPLDIDPICKLKAALKKTPILRTPLKLPRFFHRTKKSFSAWKM